MMTHALAFSATRPLFRRVLSQGLVAMCAIATFSAQAVHGAEITQTRPFSITRTGSGTGTLTVVGAEGLVGSGFTPFDSSLGTLTSFSVKWDATLTTSATVSPSSTDGGGFSAAIAAVCYLNAEGNDGLGVGGGGGAAPGAVVTSSPVVISKLITCPVPNSPRTYNPAWLAGVTGASNFNLSLGSTTPIAKVDHNGLSSVSSTLVATVTLTYTYTPTYSPATYNTPTSQVLGGWVNGGNFTLGTVNTHWPSAESPDKAVDNNTGSKFLAFRNNNAGLILSPTNATLAFNRLLLSTANDSPERDPASYVIYGSPTVLSGAAGANLPLSGLTLLASGTITLPDNRTTGPTVVQFANTTPYASYIVAFPTVRSTTGNNITQISEVQLSQGINPPHAVAMAGARGGQLSGGTFTIGSIGSNNPGTNWLANEGPDQAIDDRLDTKYLLFRNTGAGLIVSPQAGPARVNRLRFWTANDSAERDPLTYQIYGFATAVTARSGTLNVATNGTLLGSGTLTLPATRKSGPHTVTFTNSTPYASYLVVFPTVKNSPSTTMMQIAEVQFGYNGVPELTLPNTVTTWGSTWSGQGIIPSGLRDVASLSSGYGFQLALKRDGTVVAWGLNDKNQTAVPAGLAGVTSVSAGLRHSLALKNDGTVVAWGSDFDGSTVVPSELSGVVGIAAGHYHSLALKNDGTVVAWGNNSYGEKNVPAGLSGVVAIAAGRSLSLALKSDGTVVAWGYNVSGEATVPAGLSGVIAIAAGESHSLALKSDGTVVAWGYNGAGQTSVPLDLGGVARIAAGGYHSIALKSDGTVVGWGSNYQGQSNIPATLSKASDVATNGITSSAIVPWTVTVAEGSGSYSEAAFATDISAGIGDVGQTVSFSCTNDNNALFSTQPAISAEGTLTFTPAANAFGRTTVSVIATDNTGLVSSTETFVIEVSSGNFSANYGSASASQTLAIKQSGYTGPVTITAPAGYEISTDGSTFSSSLTVRRPAGTIQSVYDGDFNTATGVIWGMGSSRQFPNFSAFAALNSDGSVVTWGDEFGGGDSSSVADQLDSEVSAIYSNSSSFAALKNDGSVVTWGSWETGGNFSVVDASGGVEIPAVGHVDSGVVEVYSTSSAYAALKSDGSVVTWGMNNNGGDSSAVANRLTSGVTAIRANYSSFAALKNDGSVVTWGDADGGNSSSVAAQLTSGVTAVYSNDNAFAAVKSNGSVVTWGDAELGGNSSAVAAKLTSGVRMVQGSMGAFAALKNDGSVVTWGGIYHGGSPDVIDQLTNSLANVTVALASGVSRIYSNDYAFAALKDDGSVVTWGYAYTGGDSSSVAARLTSGVTAISSSRRAFAALKSDGSVVTWGDEDHGGDSTGVASSLASGVAAVYSNAESFAALKTDGSVVSWGNPDFGGYSSSVAAQLSSGVIAIYSNGGAYAAVKNDGTVVTWGSSEEGGTGGPSNIGVEVPLPATIHVRLASTATVGSVSGNLTLTSIGSATQTVALNGTVIAGPTHTHFELWRFANFGSYDSVASGADSADPDGDGLNNLLEYALGTAPNASGVMPAALVLNGANLEYTYTRSTAAKDNGVTYQIEWSETLGAGSWSTETVTQQITSTQGALETVKASVPAGTGCKRFLRLRVGAAPLQTP